MTDEDVLELGTMSSRRKGSDDDMEVQVDPLDLEERDKEAKRAR